MRDGKIASKSKNRDPMQRAPKISLNRRTDRAGVNAAQSFFEENDCIFQEVELQNDFGKDAYVDITSEGILSPLCVALQIKSGNSYRARSGDYLIPIGRHGDTWRNSTVPIFGIVYDPDGGALRWVDITGYLRENPGKNSGSILVSSLSVLTEESLSGDFGAAIQKYSPGSDVRILENLLSEEEEQQTSAVLDLWARGRVDSRYLRLLRRVVPDLSFAATRYAIWALSHVTSHPDIFRTSRNRISHDVADRVRMSFRWSVDEICHMFMALNIEESGRGTLGQSLHMILLEDNTVVDSMEQCVDKLLQASEPDHAMHVLITMLASVDNPRGTLREMTARHAELRGDYSQELMESLREDNSLHLY